MADNTVSVDVELAIKKATADLEKLTGRFDTFASKAEKGIGGVDKKLGFMRLTLVGLASEMAGKATQAVIAYAGAMVRNGIKAAKEYEDALNGFNVALQLSGNYSAEASKDFEDFAASIQQTTKFSDDATLSAGALIANISGLGGAPLKNATQNALDLAAALKIDLQTAAQLVGKAAVGETGTLSRYGIILGETGTKAEKAAAALALIQNKFGGAAVKDAETYSGAIAKASNNFGDLQKEMGFLVTKNPAVIAAINDASKKFADMADWLKKNETQAKNFVSDGLIAIVVGAGATAVALDVLVKGLQLVWSNAGLVINTLQTLNSFKNLDFGGVKENAAETAESFKEMAAILAGTGEESQLSKMAQGLADLAVKLENVKDATVAATEASAEQGATGVKTVQEMGQWEQWYADLKKNAQKKDVENTKSSLGVIAGLHTSNIKELFYIGKAAAIAQATINGFEAVTKAFAVGGPLGFILGPLVAVATAAQVAGIAAQQPGFATGGVVGGNSLQGDNVPIRVNSREAVMTLEQQQNLFDIANGASAGGGGGITVIVEGNVIADSPSRIDELAEAISQRVRFNNTPLYASAVV